MVKFPAPQMARGKSLLRLSNARRAEKEEAPPPSPKSHESKLAVGSDEPPLKEAAARPRAPKTRGISSLRLLKSKIAPASASSASPRSSSGSGGADKHSGASSAAASSPGSGARAGGAARLERRASSSLVTSASSSLDAALLGVRAYLRLRRSAKVAAQEPEPAAPPASVEAAVLAMQPSNERWAERHAALLALPALVAAAPTADESKRRLDALCETLPG